MNKGKKFFAWLLVAGGLLLLISGSREFIESWWGQQELSQETEPQQPEQKKPLPQHTPRPLSTFRRGELFARLSIPRLNSQWSIVEGTGKKELRRGPGHMIGTAYPGQSDNMIIAGHRDTHFRALKDIREGDEIVVTFEGEEITYRVRETQIVKPTATQVLQRTATPRLTLITCYPFYYAGSAPKRFIVQAELAGRAPLQTASQHSKRSSITP
jgi:sortase A